VIIGATRGRYKYVRQEASGRAKDLRRREVGLDRPRPRTSARGRVLVDVLHRTFDVSVMVQSASITGDPQDRSRWELSQLEGFEVLSSLARNKTGTIPESVIVEHIYRVTEGGDFPLRRDALEAVVRRVRFADDDGLSVATRPAAPETLGIYRTRRARRHGARPYDTAL